MKTLVLAETQIQGIIDALIRVRSADLESGCFHLARKALEYECCLRNVLFSLFF